MGRERRAGLEIRGQFVAAEGFERRDAPCGQLVSLQSRAARDEREVVAVAPPLVVDRQFAADVAVGRRFRIWRRNPRSSLAAFSRRPFRIRRK
jgi:hypothetical protein